MFSSESIDPEISIGSHQAADSTSITPQAEPVYRELVKIARRGNYWAVVTVSAIHQLITGRLHKDHIFVKPAAEDRKDAEEFEVILPGCRIIAKKQPEGSFKILHITAEFHYSESMQAGDRPALYQVVKTKKKRETWVPRRRKNGKISERKFRLVMISDTGYEKPDDAAYLAALRIVRAPFSGGGLRINENGFGMHFTPGNKRVGGLINYRDAVCPLENAKLYESALLLAKTMYDARNVKGVGWVAEFGGSGILTQALKILADWGVRLEDHTAFLVRPRTSPNEAIKAAHAVGLRLTRKFSEVNALDYIGNRDQLELIINRLKNEKEYNLLKAIADIAEYGKSLLGAIAFLGILVAVVNLFKITPIAAVVFIVVLIISASTLWRTSRRTILSLVAESVLAAKERLLARNYIKYPPFRWREHKGQCIPQGPSFRWAKKVTVRLTDCTLSLRLPRHAPRPGADSGEWRLLPRVYDLEGQDHSDREMPSQSWLYEGIIARSWAFYGPWFTGCRGNVHFSLIGLRLSQPNPQINFFHPRALETGALGYVTAYWGHDTYGDKAYYQAPLNWTPLEHLPLPALRFDMRRVIQAGELVRFVFFPVGRDKLMSLSFACHQYATGTQEEIDARISPEPMLALVENIIDSLQITLSPELQREVDAVRETCPEMAVSPECPPLDWPAHVDRDGLTILPYDERLYVESAR